MPGQREQPAGPGWRLQRHPIAMACHFEHCLVITWAFPAAALESLVPPGLTLDLYDQRWGFLVIAVVQTRNLRPAFLPAWVGRDYALTGYRIFVRHTDSAGRTRRGLHILRSDTDRRSMKIGGNLLTHYRYRLADISIAEACGQLDVRITTPGCEADLHALARLTGGPAPLPPSSPFRTERDARRFAGPLPWTFDHEPQTRSIIMIHGRRSVWDPRPVAAEVKLCSFLDREPFAAAGPRLASAFHVASVDYGWERGIRVPAGQP
jgi:uncharacterized protein YqjF (DUF2071 family)